MPRTLPRLWIVIAGVFSLAGNCDEQFRPIVPAGIATVTVTLVSAPVAPPTDPGVQAAYQNCLTLAPRSAVRPSWRDYTQTNLEPAGTNTWQATFNDVPVSYVNTLFVLDPNECARLPTGDGRTIQGVSVNGVTLPSTMTGRAFLFTVAADGTVRVP